jgi:ElaB/YqjD/DUF883 family membrane-anchored ribosome-binding protein
LTYAPAPPPRIDLSPGLPTIGLVEAPAVRLAAQNFLRNRTTLRLARYLPNKGTRPMAQTSTKPADFNRALGDAKKQAGDVADAVTDAAQDVYGQARESVADVAGAANTAARKTVGSIEKAIRNTIETQPYTAAAIALGIGWLLGRMHRPL